MLPSYLGDFRDRWRRWSLWLATQLIALQPCGSRAVTYTEATLDGQRALVCRVDLAREPLELFWRDDTGQPLKSFAGVNRYLAPRGRQLAFAMSAGMYHPGFTPVGLFVQQGRELVPLNLDSGQGNFFLKPNGVFYVQAGAAHLVESSEMRGVSGPVDLATQSGPLLVHYGQIHPAFQPASPSRLFRNGVGLREPGIALFVITRDPMNLHEFARLFRDELHCPDALYLDGTISSLYAPPLRRADWKMDLGPIIGVTAPR